jgi:hypothetical protein
MGVQEVRWDKGGTVRSGVIFFLWKRNKNHHLRTRSSVHRIVSAVKRVEFVSDRLPYTVLRCRWFNIIVLNIQAPNEK